MQRRAGAQVQVRALTLQPLAPARPIAWSAHVTSGVSGRPSVSSASTECIALLNDRPATSSPASRAPAIAPRADLDDRVDHDLRVLHGVALLGLEQGVAGLVASGLGAVGVERAGLRARRPDVDAYDNGGGGHMAAGCAVTEIRVWIADHDMNVSLRLIPNRAEERVVGFPLAACSDTRGPPM